MGAIEPVAAQDPRQYASAIHGSLGHSLRLVGLLAVKRGDVA
jgi:hypothetical protein